MFKIIFVGKVFFQTYHLMSFMFCALDLQVFQIPNELFCLVNIQM